MATTRVAHTNWSGGLTDGTGTVFFDSSGIGSYPVSWPARAEQPGGKTSAEELIAAALSSCYSMALSSALGKHGVVAGTIDTQARVTFEPGAGITGIQLSVQTSLTGGAPRESTPNESTPNESTPNESTPNESTPNESTPNESTPNESTPNVPPRMSSEQFQVLAEQVKETCPVSQALAGVKIILDAALVTG